MCLLPPREERDFCRCPDAGRGQAHQRRNSLCFGRVKIGKTKLRIVFIVVCVELPVGWKSA